MRKRHPLRRDRGDENIREFDEQESFATPVRITAVQFLRGFGVIAFNQKISDHIGVNEEHLLIATPRDRRFDFLCRDRATA